MTYEEIVERVRNVYENADAREIYEHIAIQVNLVGQGSGIFYIEVAERNICVEPYDYYDHDALIVTDGEMVCELSEGKTTYEQAVASGRFYVEGNMDKVNKLRAIIAKKIREQ